MALSLPVAETPNALDAHQQSIQEMIEDGQTDAQILATLFRRGVQTSKRSLHRRLQFWGLRRPQNVINNEIVEAVKYVFHHTTLNDTQIADRVSTDYKLPVTTRQIRTIRSKHNWLRASTGAKKAAQFATTQQLMEHEIRKGPARSFGRRWFITYLRQRLGFKARQDDVAALLLAINDKAVVARRPGLRKMRLENYTTPGPNFLWCLDGHDKFSQYGIEIYAAVDAFSRKIIWFYVGNSNRTPISVVRQYLNAVQTTGICPRFIRTDRGTETVLLADLHFSLFIEATLREQWSDEDYYDLRPSECYIYGPSTKNIRAEGLWRQQRSQCTGPWLDYFGVLRGANLYHQHLLADQVLVLFLFMPLLREELNTFVRTHNAHPIRAQKNRSQHVPGVPDELYRTKKYEQHGFTVNMQVLSALQGALPDYGIIFPNIEWAVSVPNCA
jgi:hypothetical protein